MLVKRGETLKIHITENCGAAVEEGVAEFADAVLKAAGVKTQIIMLKDVSSVREGVVAARFKDGFSTDPAYEYLKGSDGFCVRENGAIFVLSHTDGGLYYGLHDLIEENADVIFPRGAADKAFSCIPADFIDFSVCDYVKKSPFRLRAVNMCGKGTDGRDHVDEGSARFYGANKINAVSHAYESEWEKYGLYGVGINAPDIYINDLIDTHPEYFMTDAYGNPKKDKYESYIDYFNKDAAKEIARRIAVKARGTRNVVFSYIMPDDPYFYVKRGGVCLHEMPYVADCGKTLYPTDENYKSTIYFDFVNRIVKELNRLAPETYLFTLAYMYSEPAPETDIDEHLLVALAPIRTNDKYSYTATGNTGNEAIKENIEKWVNKCKKLCLYTYWFSFKGSIYSRPVLRTVKENLVWFESLGIYGLVVEGKLDPTLGENPDNIQKTAHKFFDMNEAYVWAVNKLTFEPQLDPDELLKRFCRIVYKEAADEMLLYFDTVKRAYEANDAYVWYATGGDVYINKFIIGAGIADDLKNALRRAEDKAVAADVKSRVSSIRKTVCNEIEKYSDYAEEECTVKYTALPDSELLSENSLDYKNNPASEWNRAVPLKILRDYDTLAFYDKAADFECRMLYGEDNICILYSVADGEIIGTDTAADGSLKILRANGAPIESYAETYIGGNVFNQSVYYGLISGYRGEKGILQFYLNDGTPKNLPLPQGVKDVKYAHIDNDPLKRYYLHVQVFPIKALGVNKGDFTPYGSFVYYTDRYGRAGWLGNGLWSKSCFKKYKLCDKEGK